VLSLGSPLQIGVYSEGKCIEQHKSEDKTSDALPVLISSLLKRFTCKGLFFAKGPGSFMAIKVTYLFLQTLHIVKDIPLYACEGFTCNGNNPIKAVGKRYFVKCFDGSIDTIILDVSPDVPFVLPHKLPYEAFSLDTEPLYHLPAV
jgi:tRNA A37 threonylcarbamoyladenosine modification protein TsaB